MEDLTNWLNQNLGGNIEIVTTPHERTEKLDFEFVPENDKQFYGIINNAPWEILRGLGFRKWANMNELIAENKKGQSDERSIEIPVINSDEPYCMNIGVKNPPKEQLEVDEVVILFPGEWYNIIPENFAITGLYGEEYLFEKNKSDDDIRFGCLAYGIRKPITFFDKNERKEE